MELNKVYSYSGKVWKCISIDEEHSCMKVVGEDLPLMHFASKKQWSEYHEISDNIEDYEKNNQFDQGGYYIG